MKKHPTRLSHRMLLLFAGVTLLGTVTPGIAASGAAARMIADATVDARYPNAKLGRKPTLQLRAGRQRSFIKFDVSGLRGAPERVTLRLYSMSRSGAGYRVGPVSGSWQERRITAREAPSGGPAVASSGPIRKDTWSEVDLTSIVRSNGRASVVLTTRSRRTVTLASKDHPNHTLAPRVVVETDPDTTPVVTPTPTESPTASPNPSPTAGPSPAPSESPTPVPSTRPFIPYAKGSFLTSPLRSDAPVDAGSSAGIDFVKSHPDSKKPYPVIRGLGSNKWGTVYAQGSAKDPVWRLTGSVPSAVSFLKTEGFHGPEWLGSILTGTSDSPFVVMDRAGVPTMPKGLTVWGAKAVAGPGHTIRVGAAGAFQHDSNGLDKRNPQSTSGKNFRSRGAIPDAMVIRKDLLSWAIANDSDLGHVLHMFWVETRTTDGFVHPMVGTESGKVGWGAEGMRIRIKPSVDLESRGLTPGGLVVARTLQNYGAYLGDNSGSLTSLKAEQDHGQWGKLLTEDALKGLTWNDFEFVKRGFQ